MVDLLGREQPQWPVDNQAGQPVDRRPGGDLAVAPAGRRDGSDPDEVVKGLVEHLVSTETAPAPSLHMGILRVAGRRPDRPEHPLLVHRIGDVGPTQGSQPGARCDPGIGVGGDTGKRRLHGLGQLGQPTIGYRGQQVVAAGEVPVAGIVGNADLAGHVAQHHRSRAIDTGGGHSSVDERVAKITVVVGGFGRWERMHIYMLTSTTPLGENVDCANI